MSQYSKYLMVLVSAIFLAQAPIVKIPIKAVNIAQINNNKILKNKIYKKHSKIVRLQSGYVLYDLTAGKTVCQQNQDSKIEPASLTKMMTYYAVLKAIQSKKRSWNDIIVVCAKAASQPSARWGLRSGTQLSLRKAVEMMMVCSANDATYAIAHNLFPNGVEHTFNQYAKELNMKQTRFGNATGLWHDQQYSTPRDLLKLMVTIRRHFPHAMLISNQNKVTFNGKTKKGTNALINKVPGVKGFKTGFLARCGWHLATYSQYKDSEFIGIFMGYDAAQKRNQDVKKKIMQYHKQLDVNNNQSIQTDNMPELIVPVSKKKMVKTKLKMKKHKKQNDYMSFINKIGKKKIKNKRK